MDRGVGVTIGRRATSTIADSMEVKEMEGKPLLDANALKALIRLLRLAQVIYGL
jgi:E3 ubiquitin-protein ligase HUWE1